MKRSIALRSIALMVLAGLIIDPGLLTARSLVYDPADAIQVPTSGSFRAIVVFVRFRDDTTVWNGCTPANQAWAQPDVLPFFVSTLLASDPNPPFPEPSLTAYFYQQSQGRFTLYGDVYPHVVVTDEDQEAYRQGQTSNVRVERVTKEVLDQINADPTFDLGAYDANDDGYIDHIFFVLRKLDPLTLMNGSSGCASIGFSSSAPEFGNNPQSLKRIHASRSGSYLHYSNAGNIFPEVNLVRLMAHEFGHELWAGTRLRGDHVEAIGDKGGVPKNGPDRVGYLLMAGSGGSRDTRGDETISAYERDVLDNGWVTCSTLIQQGRYTISDLYSDNTANCYKLRLPFASFQPRTLYVSNRQRIGYFDQIRTNTCTAPPNEHGLKTTGLLMTIAQGDRVAVVPSDNSLALNNESRIYTGDLYGPETATQLTPWTIPNIFGYTIYPEGLVLQDDDFKAIDNIDYSGGKNGEMAFDYVADFRERPVIREDSKIGAETAGYEFSTDVVVTGESVLSLNTTLAFSSVLRVERGSEVVIGSEGDVWMKAGSTLEMEDSTRVWVQGTLTIDGSTRKGRGAEIVYGASYTGATSGETNPPFHVYAPYPNPFNAQAVLLYDLSHPAFVSLRVYDTLGRLVVTLVDEQQQAGPQRAVFDGATFPSGVYYYRLDAAGHTQSHATLLLK